MFEGELKEAPFKEVSLCRSGKTDAQGFRSIQRMYEWQAFHVY
jgi:hypothetical protein